MLKNIGNIVSWTSVMIVSLSIYTQNIQIIVTAILIASILDMFDGKLARKYSPNSKESLIFGEITDSLCDIFNFGIAPSIILILIKFDNINFITYLLASIFIICGIYRLARFSALKDDIIKFYIGVPITVIGPLMAFSILMINNLFIINILFILASYLMISKLKIKKL